MKNNTSLPADVLVVKQHLMETSDKRLNTMRLLTEPEYSPYHDNPVIMDELIDMWAHVEQASKKARVTFSEKEWVYSFLEAVVYNSQPLPYYFNQTAKDKKDDIEQLKKCTKNLKKIYGRLVFEGCTWPPEYAPLPMLNTFADNAEREIRKSTQRGKRGKNDSAIRFVRGITESNMFVYGTTLNTAVKIAAFAVFGYPCSENDITNLGNRGQNYSQ
jgi:hypothetical protein